ncbi:MAG TPA: VC0807 family protein [Pseudonocardiaceae bacterium]|jgi:FtsH-binding integral membrane protein|nr:VC0807 family protein [Pseudonocardiaceae bacterium]
MTDTATKFPVDRRTLVRALPSVVLSFLLPLLVYEIARSYVDSDAVALAISAVVPVLWTLGRLVIRRRLDRIGVVSVVLFGLTLLVTVLSGGRALDVELLDPVLSGLLGLVCVGSAVVGKPLNLVVLRLAAKRNPKAAQLLADRPRQRIMTVTIVAVGAVLTVRAAVLVVLALSLPVSGFVAVSHPVGWAILIVGLAPVWWYRRRARAAVLTSPPVSE